MDWKIGDWTQYSQVELTIRDNDEDECTLTIKQSNLPAGVDKQKLEDGWKSQIITPMSKICGYPIEDD